MGNLLSDSKVKTFNVYHSYSAWQQWQLVREENQRLMGKVVRNKFKAGSIGQIRVCRQINDLEFRLKISQFRYDFMNGPIVGIYGIYSSQANLAPEINLCGRLENYSVVTQKINHCFGDMGQISFNQAMKILKSALIGAKTIMQSLKILPIYDQTMIFFDNDNNCKVWINSDVNSNYSSSQKIRITQSDSVNSIFFTIEQKIQDCPNYRNFLQQKSQSLIYSFQKALKFINRFVNEQIQPIYQHHSNQKNLYQAVTYNQPKDKKDFKEIVNNRSNKNPVKKSLSTRKFKRQTEGCVFFSARKSKNCNSQEKQTQKPLCKQLLNPNLNSNKFLSTKKSDYQLFSQNESHRDLIPKLQVSTQNQFHEQSRVQDLKKKIMNRREMKEKFNVPRIQYQKKNSKDKSNLSTQYDSTQISSNFPSRMQPNVDSQAVRQINFTKKSINRMKSPNYKKNSANLIENFVAGVENFSERSSTHRLESCYSDIKPLEYKKCEMIKKYISDQNIPVPQNSKQVFITSSTPKFSKQFSMPSFYRIHPLPSA